MAQTLLEIAEAERRRRALEEFRRSTSPAGQPAGGINVDQQAASELGTNVRGLFSGLQEGGTLGGVDEGVGVLSGVLLGGMPNEQGNIDMFNYDVPTGERYSAVRDHIRGQFDEDEAAAPGPYAVGQFGGMATPGTTGGALVGLGKTMLGTMGRMAGLGGVEGALTGAGLADAETWGEVGDNAGVGAIVGALLGGSAVPAVAGVQRAVTDPLGGLMGAIRGVGNPARAGRVVSRAFQRSGQTVGDVAQRIQAAAADGQDMFRTADALGLPGQRQLAGIARSPGDPSRQISEWLDQRQLGQNDRVSSFVADAVDTDQTANARELVLQAQRRAEGNINYGDARMEAGPVEVAPALDIIDQRLSQIAVPGMAETVNMSPLDRTLQQYRARLAVPAERLPEGTTNMALSDFSRVLEVKKELDGAITAAARTGDGFQAAMLRNLRNALDDALADASPPYANARDTFRQQSRVIDAVDQGRDAASPRVRTQDALDIFNGLAPQQTPMPGSAPQQSIPNPDNLPVPWVENPLVPYQSPAPPNPQDGFRVGYVDPLLARVENSPPGTDVSRQFTTPKTQEMLNAIAEDPELLARRIARERQMFDTRHMATGGSPTANLLQDIADVGDTAPNIAQMAMNPRQAIIQALGTKAGNFINGTNEQTRQMIARVLMSADPQAELEPLLRAAMLSQTGNRGVEGMIRQGGYQLAFPSQ